MADQGRRAHGRFGEDRAAAWYEANGYEIVVRNWRRRDGEIDLIVRRESMIVFVEVKARASEAFGLPAEAVGPAKQRRIRGLAVAFLAESGLKGSALRFDVASVLAGKVTVIEEAF
jgi:putative endonuclease